jgi:hypothetical protein
MNLRTLIQCTTEREDNQYSAHRLSVRLHVELPDSQITLPYAPQTDATVLALRALADHIEEITSGPAIIGKATILVDDSPQPILEDPLGEL